MQFELRAAVRELSRGNTHRNFLPSWGRERPFYRGDSPRPDDLSDPSSFSSEMDHPESPNDLRPWLGRQESSR